MSKIGQKPIQVPEGVKVHTEGQKISLEGAGGKLEYVLPRSLSVSQEDSQIIVKRSSDDKKTKSLHGLYRSLIANGAQGLVKQWEKSLEVVGTGYNVKLQGDELVFKLGFSHPVVVKKTEGITFAVQGNNKIILK